MSTTTDQDRWTALSKLTPNEKKSLKTVLGVLYHSDKFNEATESSAAYLSSAVDNLNDSKVWGYLAEFRKHEAIGQFSFEEIIVAAKSEAESGRPTQVLSQQEILEAYNFLQSNPASTSVGISMPTAPRSIQLSATSTTTPSRYQLSLKAVALRLLAANPAALVQGANGEVL